MVLDILLGDGVPRLVSGLGTYFLPLWLFGFKVLRGSRACSVRVLHFLRFPIFSYLALHTSMGPGPSSVLRVWSNPAEESSLGRTGEEFDSLALVVHRITPGEPSFPFGKGQGKN